MHSVRGVGALSLLLGVFLLLLSFSSFSLLVVDAAGVDDHALFDPVTVRVLSRGQGSGLFNESSGRNFLSEYRLGIVSFVRDYLAISQFSDLNVPLATVTRVTDGGLLDAAVGPLNQTVWSFVLVYVSTAQAVSPLDVYSQFETACGRLPSTGECNLPYYAVDKAPLERQWLQPVTSVNLVCCDGTWAQSLQGCPVCNAKNFLPLILGCVLSFVGAVGLFISVKLYLKKRERQRRGKGTRAPTAGVTDAGHKPPPQDLVPLFQVQPGPGLGPAGGLGSSHRVSHDGPALAASRPAHVAHLPLPLPMPIPTLTPTVVDSTTQVIDIKLSAEENVGLGLGLGLAAAKKKHSNAMADLEAGTGGDNGTGSRKGHHKHHRNNSVSQHRVSQKR